MSDLILARALHVLAVVVWIGGVSMVTTIVLPALRHGNLGTDRRRSFEAIERRFAWQARSAVLVVGATGVYMVIRLDLWSRFREVQFWWMHAMVAVWTIFAVALFVIEPLASRVSLHSSAGATPETNWARLFRMHIMLLILSLITVLGAVAGAHGWSLSR